MRQIHITVTDDNVIYPDGTIAGRLWEHCATQIILSLPDGLIENSSYLVAAFSCGEEVIYSGIVVADGSEDSLAYVADGKLYITMWQELTKHRAINLTVEAFKSVDGIVTRLYKSPLIGELTFSRAIIGDEPQAGASGLALEVFNLKTVSHEHANAIPVSKLTEDADGNPLYGGKPIGGVTVVDSYTDLPADAAEGDLAYVRLETESGDGSPVDLSDCPKYSDVSSQIEAEYIAQGGTVGDSGWYDFEQNYTNCDFSAGALKLGVPIYRPVADIDAFFHVGLSLGTNYGERELLLVRPILFLVGSEVLQSEYAVFVPDSEYNYEYMSGCVPVGEVAAPEEFTENDITKYIIKVATVYAFENLSGQLYNTGGMFDGLQINLARGWNSVALVMTEEFLPERAEILPQSDVYLPTYTFWILNDIDDEYEEIFARTAITDMLTDTTQSITIPPALYIRADGEWRKTS